MPMTPFENTYRVTSTKETAEKYGNPKTITELVAKAEEQCAALRLPRVQAAHGLLLGLDRSYNWTAEVRVE